MKTDLSHAGRNSASRRARTATSESPPCRYQTCTSKITQAVSLTYISLSLCTCSCSHVVLVQFLQIVLTHPASYAIFILRILHGVAIMILIPHRGTLKFRGLFRCRDLPVVTELGKHRTSRDVECIMGCGYLCECNRSHGFLPIKLLIVPPTYSVAPDSGAPQLRILVLDLELGEVPPIAVVSLMTVTEPDTRRLLSRALERAWEQRPRITSQACLRPSFFLPSMSAVPA